MGAGLGSDLTQMFAAGLLEEHGGEIVPAGVLPADQTVAMCRFLAKVSARIRPVHLKNCPLFFTTALADLPRNALVSSRSATVAAGGQGMSQVEAAVSCTGELIERMSLFSHGPADPRLLEKGHALPDLDASEFLKFSSRQERALAARFASLEPIMAADRINWNRVSDRRVRVVHRYSGEARALPALAALMGEQHHCDQEVPGVASTIGAAVWSTREEASRRAVLELVERDAAAQLWYNRLGITLLPDAMLGAFLPNICADFLRDRTRITRFFAVHTDFNAHVLLAASWDPQGRTGTLGVAAGLSVPKALFSAVTELLQGEMSLELAAKAYPAHGAPGTRLPKALAYSSSTDIRMDLHLDDAPVVETACLQRVFTFEELDRSLQCAGIDIWEFDASIRDYGFHCIRAMSPQLVDWQPRFAPGRLYDGVVERGLRATRATEEEFAQRPFPF